MKMINQLFLSGVLLLLAAAPASAVNRVEIEGVAFERAVTANGTALELQGYGLLRHMIFIKAYVGALYLPPSAAAGDVLEPVAKRLELQYFHAIKKEDFAHATRIKIADNVTAEQVRRLGPRIDQLASMYKDVRPGDRYGLTFIPGRGTELALNDTVLGIVPGDDFARAIFSVWLGQNPIDVDFRNVLLGAR